MKWEGDGFSPLNSHWAKQCDKQFVVGQVYRVTTVEERSAKSHSHFFACLHEAFINLPTEWAERFCDEDALRKYALIISGFADERSIVCSSQEEAQSMAAFIKPMDRYCIVVVKDATLKVYTAKSQSLRAMGKADFQASKDAVLEVIAKMLEVDVESLNNASSA